MSRDGRRDSRRGGRLVSRRTVLLLAGATVLGGCGRAAGGLMRDIDGATRQAGAYLAWRLQGGSGAVSPRDEVEPPIVGHSSLDGRR